MQNTWSVVDLLRRNPHWWSPIISSAYGVNLVLWDIKQNECSCNMELHCITNAQSPCSCSNMSVSPLTKQQIPWSGDSPEKPEVPQLIKKFSALHRTWRFFTVFPLPPIPILSQINLVHAIPYYPTSMPRCSKWHLSFSFLHQKPVCISLLPSMCHNIVEFMCMAFVNYSCCVILPTDININNTF